VRARTPSINIMQSLRFDNRFIRELPGDPAQDNQRREVRAAYSRVQPTPVAAPRLLAYSREMAQALGLSREDIASSAFAEIFAGNRLLPGMEPFAANYGGHQFGHWAGQLGDGRAIGLGEVVGADGRRWELQLKGAGPTPYSRRADGRAVLRSSVREFLCSEAMHHLGVPTTRALSLVTTGEAVMRDMFYDGHPAPEPGAIVCRVAPSFIRFGNFELPASRDDKALLEQLIDFTIRRDFSELIEKPEDSRREAVRAEWFAQVCERTARMVAHWMRVGFVHGVMNTDNMSILGLTIDYGPYGWIDNFDLDWTPNTTDAQGRRYRFGNQPQIAYWNLAQLANALTLIFDNHDLLQAGIDRYVATFGAAHRGHCADKLGLATGDDTMRHMETLYGLLQAAEVDMTLFFTGLGELDIAAPSLAPFEAAFYDPKKRDAHADSLMRWLGEYAGAIKTHGEPVDRRRARMQAANPRYVLRNYLAQLAIDRAAAGDAGGVEELLEVLRRPYSEQAGKENFAARRPDWARNRAGCSMLSCSS